MSFRFSKTLCHPAAFLHLGKLGNIYTLPERSRAGRAARPKEAHMPQEKVLIVEDEENARTGLAELVSSWGFRTETAKDGLEGLEKITAWAPSIVLTDLK